MHKNLKALDPTQAMLRKVCQELHPDWEFMFWTDEKLDDFVHTHFSWFYKDWAAMHPRIKQLDTSRYMLMHHFGGVYLDVDVECVRNLDDMVAPLPRGSAWVGDFPEPMFLASAQGNQFWLHMLQHVNATWQHHDAWHSTGPAGLNDAFVSYLHLHGHSVLVPFLTQRTEKEFHEFIKDKNDTVPYYMLANGLARLEGPGAAPLKLWHSKEHYRPLQPDHQVVWHTSNFTTFRTPGAAHQQQGRGGEEEQGAGRHRAAELLDDGAATVAAAADERVVAPEGWRIGFLANELLDPAGCGPALGACKLELCKQMWPHSYLIHHCLNTWRGRIGDTR